VRFLVPKRGAFYTILDGVVVGGVQELCKYNFVFKSLPLRKLTKCIMVVDGARFNQIVIIIV